MGGDMHAAIAHVALACVAGPSLSRVHFKNYTVPGLHTNLLVHGVLGFLNHHGGFGDVAGPYKISLAASRYLPIPCLMADIRRGNDLLSLAHFLSGAIPFALACTGSEDQKLGNLMVGINIVALVLHSHGSNSTWGWYTAGAAVFTYLAAPQIGGFGPKVVYPLSLALMEYCSFRVHALAAEVAAI